MACMRSSSSRRSGPSDQRASPPSRTGRPAPRRSPRSGSAQPAGVDRDGSRAARERGRRGAARSHGTPPNWSAWVASCSATQRSSSSGSASSAAAAWPRFGATNSSRAGASGSSSGNSYWPSTRWARKPGDDAHLGGEHARRPRRSTGPAQRAEPARRRGPRPGRARAHASRGSRRSTRRRSTASAAGTRRRRRDAGRCRRRPAARSPPRARERLERGRVRRGLQREATVSATCAASRQSIIDSMVAGRRRGSRVRRGPRASSRQAARALAVRAATTGECGDEVQRRAERRPRSR